VTVARSRLPRPFPALLAAALVAAAPLVAVPVRVNIGIDPSHLAGTDDAGRVLLYAPDPLQQGSSISHWDLSAFPNLLMEPAVSSNLAYAQIDLTHPLLRDLGWPPGSANVQLGFNDGPASGFNDPTLGPQRRNAIEAAAQIWSQRLGSSVTIHVEVRFSALPCSTSGGTLAQAGPDFIAADFAGAPLSGTWYPAALAEALAGRELAAPDGVDSELSLTFNSRIDEGCLGGGSSYYYGLDGNLPPSTISFVNVALHEIAHGLGFASFVDATSGALFQGQPDVYSRRLFDLTIGRHWHEMTNAERRQSAINDGNLVWNGPQVISQAPAFLRPGPALRVDEPVSVAGFYRVGLAQFGPQIGSPGVGGELVEARDGTGQPTLACGQLVNAGQVAGKIALVDRGVCNFTVKVKNAQNAGARGVVVVNNAPGSPPQMGGTDPTVTIPAVSIRQIDGEALREALGETEPPGDLAFSAATYTAAEGAGEATIEVIRRNGVTGPVSVDYQATAGTATAGADFTPVSGTLTFADGDGGPRSFTIPLLDDDEEEDPETVELRLMDPTGGAGLVDPRTAVLTVGDDEPCTPDLRTLCLNDERFRLRVSWRDFEDGTGEGTALPFGTDDSGLFWFFDDDNWEMLVKVIDGCGFNGHYWLFSAATTNVEYTLTVTDTLTGEVATYTNPLGVRADAITDTEAFATCP